MKKFIACVFLCLLFYNSFSQCENSYVEVSESEACAPKIIQLVLKNAPLEAATYLWDAGKGQVYGTDTNYTFYDQAIVVDVSVKITLSSGGNCTVSKKSAITINDKPSPVFDVSRDKLCNGPDTIKLIDITPNSEKRSWIVDGTSYNNSDQSTIHKFVSLGKKDISLIVTDSNGCQGISQLKNVVEVFPDLKFDFNANKKNGCVPLDVTYKLTSNPKSQFKKSYYWEIDGVVNKFQYTDTPSRVTYSDPGEFSTTLRVDLSNGCSYRNNKVDYIKVGEQVSLNLGMDKNVFCIGDTVKLKQINILPPGNTSWSISGTKDTLQGTTNSSSYFVPSEIGYVTVKLTHNYNSCVAQQTFKDTVRIRGVKANFKSDDRYHCEVPHTVHLQNLSDQLDAQNISYVWFIKNEGKVKYTSQSFEDSFTFYQMPAFYDVTLFAYGDNGCLDSMTKNRYIYQDSLVTDFDVSPQIGCLNQEIKFNNKTKPSSFLSSDNFEWHFLGSDRQTIIGSAFTRSASMSYQDTGYYDVMLIGKNGINCRDTLRLDAIIRIVDPILDYNVDQDIICQGESFKFTGLTRPTEAKFKHNWKINHLESSSSKTYSGQSIKVQPALAGEYELIYSHEINGGCLAYDTIPVYVNGIAIDLALDTANGCAPLTVNAKANIKYNYNFGKNSNNVTYAWKINQKNGYSLTSDTSDQAKAIFYQDQDYRFNSTVTNVAGCSSKSSSSMVKVGVKADFNIADIDICFGDSLTATDNSTNNASVLEWKINPSVASHELYTGNGQYKFSIPVDGDYTLTQIVHRDYKCFDTINKPFKVIEVISKFSTTDTFLICSPVFVEFLSSSKNGDSLFWDFGDGEKALTTSQFAGHLYNKNSGWGNGFDIKLIAKSVYGCMDTMTKNNYVVVQGPVPYFEILNKEGCEPVHAKFIDLSVDATKTIWNFNDGTPIYNSNQKQDTINHDFRVFQDSAKSMFKVDLVTYDSLGCAAYYTSLDSIVVINSPEIQFLSSSNNKQCVPFTINLEDRSTDVVRRKWVIDTLTTFTDSIGSLKIADFGEYQSYLIAENAIGCTDSFHFVIKAKEKPKVNFVQDNKLCRDKLAVFQGNVAHNTPLAEFQWNMGEPSNPQNTNAAQVASIVYQNRGEKTVKFKVVLENGCSDSTSKKVLITDEADIEQLNINYLSFDQNNILTISFQPTTYSKFSSYEWRKSGIRWVNVQNRDSSVIFDQFNVVPYDSLCYEMAVQDYCDFTGKPTAQHCFIHLRAQSISNYTNILSWTPYIGWSDVKAYYVHRSTDGINFQKVGQVKGDLLQYIDSNLCNTEYTYYVEAIHPSENFKSRSTRVTQTPIYTYNDGVSSIQNVSVIAEDEIEVKWHKSKFQYFNNYVVYKYNNDGSQLISEFEVTDTFMRDKDVNTNDESYIYRILEKDRCGYLNQGKNYGKSILLQGYYANESATTNESRLNWTKYEDWSTGVKDHNVILYDVPKKQKLASLGANDTTFVDAEFHPEIVEKYCYQVYATNQDKDTSYSNILCVGGKGKIDIPTAFTPNKDGLNDEFKPVTQFMKSSNLGDVKSYHFEVFNRWGELIFETNNISEGWDGKYRGNFCQQGVYIYKLAVQNLDNHRSYYSGNITLILN
jgi:gliding motility-associated-like protein